MPRLDLAAVRPQVGDERVGDALRAAARVGPAVARVRVRGEEEPGCRGADRGERWCSRARALRTAARSPLRSRRSRGRGRSRAAARAARSGPSVTGCRGTRSSWDPVKSTRPSRCELERTQHRPPCAGVAAEPVGGALEVAPRDRGARRRRAAARTRSRARSTRCARAARRRGRRASSARRGAPPSRRRGGIPGG